MIKYYCEKCKKKTTWGQYWVCKPNWKSGIIVPDCDECRNNINISDNCSYFEVRQK